MALLSTEFCAYSAQESAYFYGPWQDISTEFHGKQCHGQIHGSAYRGILRLRPIDSCALTGLRKRRILC